MAGRVVGLRVQGLNEFQRALRQADQQLSRDLRKGLNEVAAVIAVEAAAAVPKVSGRLSRSIRPSSTSREGRVQEGTAVRVAYAGWIDFGGKKRNKGGRPSERPFVRTGRFLYPTYFANRRRVAAMAERIVVALAERLSAG